MNRWLLRITLLICGIVLSITTQAQVNAPPPPVAIPVDGINVMLIVDQSGSMGGRRYSDDPAIERIWGDGTDVDDQRFEAPKRRSTFYTTTSLGLL